MTTDTPSQPQMPCPRCEGVAVATMVRTAIWPTDDSLVVVEDIPAHVCNQCLEQFYDEDVSDALRVLMERGFPTADAKRVISVPIFSLEGRVRKRAVMSDDTYLD